MIFWPFGYARRELPGPGSENLAFLNLALNFQTPIGAGIANALQYQWQTPATLVPHVIGVDGIGGLLSGQVDSAPLANPYG